MTYITTCSGIHIDPIHPEPELIRLGDIAHALSLICRANGHFRSFYSVAQHCIACSAEAEARGLSRRVQLACLLHDASEAYLCDLTTPVKSLMPEYIAAEERLLGVIERKFFSPPLSGEERAAVKEIDGDMLSCEFHLLMPEEVSPRRSKIVSDVRCGAEDFAEVERAFLALARRLTAECGQ